MSEQKQGYSTIKKLAFRNPQSGKASAPKVTFNQVFDQFLTDFNSNKSDEDLLSDIQHLKQNKAYQDLPESRRLFLERIEYNLLYALGKINSKRH